MTTSTRPSGSDAEVPVKAPGPRRQFITLAVAASELPCLVVGGGTIGTRKAVTLVAQGADVRLVAPAISPRLAALADAGRLRWIAEPYRSEHLDGARLVVAATSDRDLNSRIAFEARARGVLVCQSSRTKDSQVIFPALCSEGLATVAVHTGGAAPRFAKRLRDHIIEVLRRHPLESRQEVDHAGR